MRRSRQPPERQDEGTYQHNLIQASLLRKWKMQSKQVVEDGYYGIWLVTSGASSEESSGEETAVRRDDDVDETVEERPIEGDSPASRSRHVARAASSRPAESPLRGGDDDDNNNAHEHSLDNSPSLWTRAADFAADFTSQHQLLVLAIFIAMVLASTWAALFALLPSTCPYGERTTSLQPPASIPPILEYPHTVRPADEDAFDRIAMMLPANWEDWLVQPPYLSTTDSQYPTSSIRDAHRGLGRLVRNSPWRDQDSQPLHARIRYSAGFDDLNNEYFHDLEYGWLRDTAQCWRTPLVGRLYCPLRYFGAVARAQESVIDPLEAYVAKELGFLQTAFSLLSSLEILSTEQQADILISLQTMFATSAERRFPLDFAGEINPGSSDVKFEPDHLTTLYEHYAQVSFFELLSTTIKPEIQTRIDRLQAFQQAILQQRQFLLESSSAVPAFYLQILDWLAGDAAYALRSTTFADATTMRQRACNWTLARLPLRNDDDDHAETAQLHRQHLSSIANPPPIPQTSLLRRALTSLIAGASHCNPRPTPQEEVDQLRTSRSQTHNALFYLLWLSKTAPPSVRWHWEEGGSRRRGWEAQLEEEWKRYVQGRVEGVRNGVEGEDRELVLSRMVPRGDRGSLQGTWPGIRSRKECTRRHEESRGEQV